MSRASQISLTLALAASLTSTSANAIAPSQFGQNLDAIIIPDEPVSMASDFADPTASVSPRCIDVVVTDTSDYVGEACMSDASLDDLRGGETFVVGNQTLTAITSGNVLNGDYFAGNVSLADNALSNFTGIGNLIINTGAQVSLQAGMNLIINTGP